MEQNNLVTINDPSSAKSQFSDDTEKLLESAILSNLMMPYENRIEAHENARQLMLDLMDAGKKFYAT